jgi:membrane associated rhomboid family serine protease
MKLIFARFSDLPRVTKTVIAVSCAMYVLDMFLGPTIYVYLGLVPYLLTHKFWLWQPVTYMFLHGGFFHIFFNMFMMWMLGGLIEGAIGSKKFLVYFLVTGMGAALFNVLFAPNSMVPVIGASGAIYGLLLAFGMMYPNATVFLYFLIPVKAKYLAVVLGVIELASSFFSSYTGIANLAHLGGLLTGFLYLKLNPELLGSFKTVTPVRQEPDFVSKEEVDAILDKIRHNGMDSLNLRERHILEDVSRRMHGL